MIHIFKKGINATTFVMFHGTGGDEYDLLSLATLIDKDASVLSLRGQHKENGMNRFFKRFENGQLDLKSLEKEATLIDTFILEKSKEFNFDLSKTILIGFSNGANIIQGLMQYGSIGVAAACLISPVFANPSVAFNNTITKNVYMTKATNDPLCSYTSLENLEATLKNNFNVTSYVHSDGHRLSYNVVESIKKWYASLLIIK